MHILLVGATGALGRVVAGGLDHAGHRVIVVGRTPRPDGLGWDGETLGPWADAVSGADAVINLARGRAAAAVVGLAIARARRPPRVWLQRSSSAIYAPSLEVDQDETTGTLDDDAPGATARAAEAAQAAAPTPRTRTLALRAGTVMSPEPGGLLDRLCRRVRRGLGGPIAGGHQYLAWIHEHDYLRALELLLVRTDLAGPINVCAPAPVPQRAQVAALRAALGVHVALPTPRAMLWATGSQPAIVLRSRRVVPGRLRAAGFSFAHPHWDDAARDLVARWRAARGERPVQDAAALIQPPPTTRSPS